MLTSQAESTFDIKRLKELRKRAGLSQVELAERSGISALTITHIETGLSEKPHPKTVAKICAALSACFPDGLPMGGGHVR